MQAESARATTAAEARFRIQAPNSLPRAIKVVALDSKGEDALRRLAATEWRQATFYTAATFTRDLQKEVASADLVVMVVSAGGDASAAAEIGRACSDRRVTTTALIVDATDASDTALAKTLTQVRPWALMVVIANANDYVEDMLLALRA